MTLTIDALLDRDHAVLRQLAQEMRSCARPAAARALFKQFTAALGGHLTAGRKVVRPVLASAGWSDPRCDLLLGETHFTHTFAELLTLKLDTAAFTEALSDVLEATDQLVKREQDELLPLLREHLDEAQLLSLALEAERYLVHPGMEEHSLRLHASDWLEEARLLLGGLQATPTP